MPPSAAAGSASSPPGTSAAGVPCYAGSAAEIYLEQAFRDAGLGPQGHLPVVRALGETSLCLPYHPTLMDEHAERTIEVVNEVMGRATRQQHHGATPKRPVMPAA